MSADCSEPGCDRAAVARGLCGRHYRRQRRANWQPAPLSVLEPTKRCKACNDIKPVEEFHRSRDSVDGRRGQCKTCHLAQTNGWRKANPDRARETHRLGEATRKARVQGDGFAAIVKADPCSYCGEPAGTVDHIVPRDAGGDDTWENMTGACLSCNSGKAARSLLGYLLAKKIRDERELLDGELRLLQAA